MAALLGSLIILGSQVTGLAHFTLDQAIQLSIVWCLITIGGSSGRN